MAISETSRAVAASSFCAGRHVISLEKLGYQWEQTDTHVRVMLSFTLSDAAHPLIESNFTEHSIKLRITDGEQRTYFFDVDALHQAIDPEASRVIMRTQRSQCILILKKSKDNVEWVRVRA